MNGLPIDGMEEVRSSILLSSTPPKTPLQQRGFVLQRQSAIWPELMDDRTSIAHLFAH